MIYTNRESDHDGILFLKVQPEVKAPSAKQRARYSYPSEASTGLISHYTRLEWVQPQVQRKGEGLFSQLIRLTRSCLLRVAAATCCPARLHNIRSCAPVIRVTKSGPRRGPDFNRKKVPPLQKCVEFLRPREHKARHGMYF